MARALGNPDPWEVKQSITLLILSMDDLLWLKVVLVKITVVCFELISEVQIFCRFGGMCKQPMM